MQVPLVVHDLNLKQESGGAPLLENGEKRGTRINRYFLYFFSPLVLCVLSY